MSTNVTALLTRAVQSGASDIHLSSGTPPMMRLDGSMKRLAPAPLSRDEVHALVYDIMDEGQRKMFEESLELDFSCDLGDAGRFRVNVFMQQHGEGRRVSGHSNADCLVRGTRVAATSQPTVYAEQGVDPGDRPERLWKIDHPGRYGQPSQRDGRRAYRHD